MNVSKKHIVLSFLSSKPRGYRLLLNDAVAKECGIGYGTLHRAAKSLLKEGQLTKHRIGYSLNPTGCHRESTSTSTQSQVDVTDQPTGCHRENSPQVDAAIDHYHGTCIKTLRDQEMRTDIQLPQVDVKRTNPFSEIEEEAKKASDSYRNPHLDVPINDGISDADYKDFYRRSNIHPSNRYVLDHIKCYFPIVAPSAADDNILFRQQYLVEFLNQDIKRKFIVPQSRDRMSFQTFKVTSYCSETKTIFLTQDSEDEIEAPYLQDLFAHFVKSGWQVLVWISISHHCHLVVENEIARKV